MIKLEPFKLQRKNLNLALPVDSSTWLPPKELPNLSGAKSLAVDTETKDPELLTAGPGWARDAGHIVGFSIATEDDAWYFPIRHEMDAHLNMDPDSTLAWANDVLSTNIPKIYANAGYDIGWLKHEGVNIQGIAYDVQAAEALINGNKFSYSLESIAQEYLAEGKESNELYNWCARAYGGKPNGAQRANIYRAPIGLVGSYAESDARLPYAIFDKQSRILQDDGLWKVFELESRIIPMLVDMRMRGVRIDEEALVKARRELNLQIECLRTNLNRVAGFTVNPNSSNDLARMCNNMDIPYEFTTKGNPSFQAVWLERQSSLARETVA